jgi:hypothetical protein
VINVLILNFLAPLSANLEGKTTLIGIGYVVGNTPDTQCDATTFPGNTFIFGVASLLFSCHLGLQNRFIYPRKQLQHFYYQNILGSNSFF